MRRGGVGGREGGVGVGVKKTRYEGRQRRREAAGERFIRGDGFSRSPETERAKEKEGVREGRREEKGMGGVGWGGVNSPTVCRLLLAHGSVVPSDRRRDRKGWRSRSTSSTRGCTVF